MNLVELEKQLWPIVVRLAENPAVKAEMEAALIEIIKIAKIEGVKSLPVVFRIVLKVLTWINKNIKGAYKTMKRKFSLQRFSADNVTSDDTTTTGILVVTVQNSAESAISGASVTAVLGDVTVTGTTGTDGTASLSDVAAGTYALTIAADGYSSGSVDAVVTAGATSSTTVTLIATATSAVTTVITAVLSELTEIIQSASETAVDNLISDLEAEIESTSSVWVGTRDKLEVAFLNVVKSVVVSALVSALTSEITTLLNKVLANEAAAQK